MVSKKIFIILNIFVSVNLYSQKFVEIQSVFPKVQYPHIQFLDFNSDNRLDIAVWGMFDSLSSYRSLVGFINNENNYFDPVTADSLVLYGATIGHINVGDINKDNIPELVTIGKDYKMTFSQYSENSFTQITNEDISFLNSASYKGVYFADFDHDGADEILESGNYYDTYKRRFNFYFENVYGEWTLPIDINNDGYIDILRIHKESDYSTSFIYQNNGNGFDKREFSYYENPWLLEKGDYNNDGFEDLLIFSRKNLSDQPTVELYKNDKNGNLNFVKDICKASSGRFADIDNDGDLDLVLMGYYDVWGSCYLKFFQNNGNDDFSAMPNDSIRTDLYGDIRVGDYDSDGDNDILLCNYEYYNGILKLYKNLLIEENPGLTNNAPAAPRQLKCDVNFNKVKLSWASSTDKESPSSSLSYNVFIKKSDNTYITSPVADLNSGNRKIDSRGNAGTNLFYEIDCLDDGKYYWSVQAIDNSNKGSLFAVKDSFEITGTIPEAPSDLVAETISAAKIRLRWKDNSAIEDGFIIEMYYDSIPGYRPAGFYPYMNVKADSTDCYIDYLSPENHYIFRVRSFNCSASSPASDTVTAFTYPPAFSKKIILDNFYGREAEWGDFDRNGSLDILMFGHDFTGLLENNGTTFTQSGVELPLNESPGEMSNGSLNWFDYNSDGLLDICMIQGYAFRAKFKLFRNNGDRTFTDIKCDSVLGIVPGSCGPAFADYDNDGDQDILLMGRNMDSFEDEIHIYKNLGDGKFSDSGIQNIKGTIKSRMPWCDFNNDGYIDILVNELNEDWTSHIVIYKNEGNNTFSKINYAHLSGLSNDYLNQSGDMRWGDYNNDGFADILISGQHTSSNGEGITRIYRNNGDETFTDSGIDNIYGMAHDVSMEWGDFNNDGILDILQSGDGWINGVAGRTRIFYNVNGSFQNETGESFLENHQYGMSTAGDYDNDGDLDILVLGEENYIHHQVALYDNFQPVENSKPAVPANLNATCQDNEVTLRWNRSSDNETPFMGLSYNVYLNGPAGSIIAPAALENGKRSIVASGNAFYNNFLKIKELPPGIYSWSVQSLDNCFEGSGFAPADTFEITETGFNDKPAKRTSLLIYPNPVSDMLTVEIVNSQTDYCSVTVMDLTGKIFINVDKAALPYHLNISGVNSGIYFITVIQNHDLFVEKIVKK